MSSLKNALTFATFTDGIPFIYYGTEQGFRGGDDPGNREPLWPSQFNQNTEIYRFLGQINRIRSQVDSSFFNHLHTSLYTSSNVHVGVSVVIYLFRDRGTHIVKCAPGLQKRQHDYCRY
jgi:alpha-amylase